MHRTRIGLLRPTLRPLQDFTQRLTSLSHVTSDGMAANVYETVLTAVEQVLLLP